ncbi:MAG: Sapep family Mn(2+)-dependent dipeptidase [Bacilli bacterium]|jgi:succinyl-diaminopimelate desuccinylase
MNIDFKALCTSYHTSAIENLRAWIKIPSVLDLASVRPDAPFGEEVYRALRFIGEMAEEDGFEVDYCDGYVTEISFGTGKRTIGIFAHADVVPATGNWNYPPFEAVLADEKIYGRGTSDDKGPAMAAYYALKVLKDNDLINNYRVVLVIGGNEENGSRCLDYYFNQLKKPHVDFGFTPDGNFPLIYGEKGIVNFALIGEFKWDRIKKIEAGQAVNLVIDEAKAIVDGDSNLEKALSQTGYRYQLTPINQEECELIFYGTSAHGSVPELGDNAGTKLIGFLGEFYRIYPLQKTGRLLSDLSGKELDIFTTSSALGATTLNVGLINYDGEKFFLAVNFRFPETLDCEKAMRKVQDRVHPLDIKYDRHSPVLLFSKDSSFVQTLLEVYQKETGDYQHQPLTIGGGTYAKSAQNTLAFGSAFPGRNDLIHAPNEHIHLSDFLLSMSIYAHAIAALGRKDALKI